MGKKKKHLKENTVDDTTPIEDVSEFVNMEEANIETNDKVEEEFIVEEKKRRNFL